MKLQIDCYSKEDYSVQIDYSGRYPIERGERGDLFLFVCYVLRQLQNLGDHMVADALAGILTNYSSAVIESELPTGVDLLVIKARNLLKAQGMNEFQVEMKIVDLKLALENDPRVPILEKDFLAYIPHLKIQQKSGDAKKQFILTLPPLNLQMKGFGFLFGDVRYYALTSTLILYKFLAAKYQENSKFQRHLFAVANICSNTHFFKQIPVDIPGFATRVVSELEKD